MGEEPLAIAIDIQQLRAAVGIALDRAEEALGQAAAVDADYFWSIPAAERFNVYATPTDLTIGQISELVSHVDKLVENPEMATSQHLVWLGDLLRAVGDLSTTGW